MAAPRRFAFPQRFERADAVQVCPHRRDAGGLVWVAAEGLTLPRIAELEAAEAAAQRAHEGPALPQAPVFTQEELEAQVALARERAANEGAEAARAQMLASIEHRQAGALAVLAQLLAASQEGYEAMIGTCARASRELALALARALVPRALARAPLADIEAMLTDLVARLEEEPRLEVRLPADLVEPGRQLLSQVARAAGFRSGIEVIADAALGPGDATLSWRGGKAERDLGRIEAEALALVDVWLPAAAADGAGLADPQHACGRAERDVQHGGPGIEHCEQEDPRSRPADEGAGSRARG